ncbi:nitroreductase family deazaflavin-dependent oxidoreductase, partial [Agrobacterium sp. S2]|nr:nitroreductase family deazaflavin-dependent oxidoreductase [Agrobacterium sp. S2]
MPGPEIAAIRRALDIDTGSSAWERTVDITTIGAKSGLAHRIEIWFHHIHGRWYLSSTPARRDWYANLRANPRFTFHLKHGVHADLQATAHPVDDPEERHRIFQYIARRLQ